MVVNGTDLSMIRGDSESITVSCRDSQGAVSFNTGDKLYFTIKKNINTKETLMQKIITEFTEDGNAVVEIEHEDTKDMAYGGYMYDMQLTRLNGKVTTIIPPSQFVISGEVTHD